MPGTVMPWNRTGENSIIRPVQLISQPTTPVKTGIESKCSQSTCWKNQSISSAATVYSGDVHAANPHHLGGIGEVVAGEDAALAPHSLANTSPWMTRVHGPRRIDPHLGGVRFAVRSPEPHTWVLPSW